MERIERRRVLLGLASLSWTPFAAGCLGDSDETDDEDDDSENEESEENEGSDENGDRDGETADEESEESAPTVDGLTFGSESAPCGVVFVPQINTDRTSWTDQAESLIGEDRFGLAIDPDEDRPRVVNDAVAHLKTNVGVDHVVLVGASIGGEAAVIAASDNEDVDGVVALSPGGGTDHVADIRARSLFVAAENDTEFVETTRTLHENAPEPTRLEVVSGGEHGQRLFDTEHGDDLTSWIDDVIDAACRDN